MASAMPMEEAMTVPDTREAARASTPTPGFNGACAARTVGFS